MSTNETFFFRDPKTFDYIRYKFVPEFFNDPAKKTLAVWSAASSSGQEAYSVCMVLKELLLDITAYRIRVYGTDISSTMVNAANKGIFSTLDLGRGLDQKQIDRSS
jgi:chemotaxis protein methyltransferase CheR